MTYLAVDNDVRVDINIDVKVDKVVDVKQPYEMDSQDVSASTGEQPCGDRCK